jgi:hypothetical protein
MWTAIFQIPICIAFVFVIVQLLRYSAVALLDYFIRRVEDNLKQR